MTAMPDRNDHYAGQSTKTLGRADWIDVNGHMNVGYYSVVFDFAPAAFFASLDLAAAPRAATGAST